MILRYYKLTRGWKSTASASAMKQGGIERLTALEFIDFLQDVKR